MPQIVVLQLPHPVAQARRLIAALGGPLADGHAGAEVVRAVEIAGAHDARLMVADAPDGGLALRCEGFRRPKATTSCTGTLAPTPDGASTLALAFDYPPGFFRWPANVAAFAFAFTFCGMRWSGLRGFVPAFFAAGTSLLLFAATFLPRTAAAQDEARLIVAALEHTLGARRVAA